MNDSILAAETFLPKELPCFDVFQAVKDVNPHKIGIKKKLYYGMVQHERDRITWIEVISKAEDDAQLSKSGEFVLSFELLVEPTCQKLHDSLQGPIGKKAVTLAIATDWPCLLLSALCRECDHFPTLAQVAFKVSPIDALVKLSEENFLSEKHWQLQCRLESESFFAEQSKKFPSIDIRVVIHVGPVKNDIEKKICNGMCYHERDWTALFETILKGKVHAQPSKSREFCFLLQLLFKPPSRKFHDSLQGPTGKKAATLALATDQLHLLQNAFCCKCDHFLTLEQVSFRVFLIDAFIQLGEENLSSKKYQQLQHRLEAESCFVEQSKNFSGNSVDIESEDESETHSPQSLCITDEQLHESLLLVGAASSPNLIPSSEVSVMPGHPLWRSPSACGETCSEFTENTFQAGYASARPLFNSAAKLQAQFDGILSSGKGLLTREDHHYTKNVVVHDVVEQSHQEYKQSEQLNCTCSCCQKNNIVVSQLQRSNDIINAANSQLQDDVATYQDRCREQEDEINQLKEKLTQMEVEKLGLEVEVGRQLFLEGKEKRRKLQSEHAQKQSTLGTTRGAPYKGEQLHGTGSMNRSEQLTSFCHESGELSERGTFSCPEGNQIEEWLQRSYNEADETSDKSEECRESNETTVWNYFNGNVFNSDCSLTSRNLNADYLPDSRSVTGIGDSMLSSCGSVSSLSQSSVNSANNVPPLTGDLCSITMPLNFDQAAKASESFGDDSGSGKENQEKSLSSSMAYEHFGRKELKGSCPANGERGMEDLDSFNGFWNGDLVDGAVSIPNRTQGSLNIEEVPGENQSSFLHRDTTLKQNLSAARFADQLDTVIDESDCYASNQSIKWENLGARPRDRPPKGNRPLEPTLTYSSLVDLVPHQVAGVANTFLARHSEDKSLHESVYYNHAEKMLAEDVSLQGADSHIEGMTNLANLNRVKLYPSDSQIAPRPDPTYCPPCSSVFPLIGGASIRGNDEDGNLFSNTLYDNSVLPPGPSYSDVGANISTNSNFNSLNLGLLASSSGSAQINDNQPSASTDFPTSSFGARANGSGSRLLSEEEVPLVSSIRGGMNTPGHRSSNNALNTNGNHLASGTQREGNGYVASSGSFSTSGANTGGNHDQHSGLSEGSVPSRDYGTESVESYDNSLLELEQRVEEACAMVERVLREREEREEFGQEIERKEREIRAERARKKREREARELEEARGWPQQQEPVTGQSLWLCEHYQRHCRVRFPCCTNFYSCHRCHNNSKECDNEEAKASHATHLKCSYCHHEQEIAEDSAKCRSCGAKMSAYFCGVCKHFTSIDKNPYHCAKCGICRIHKDKSFHCDVCNVCLDKRLQGKHKCRPDSGHDECCICLEDAFSGCQILPCSHKVHRECAIAMIQNGIRTCPVCRHPLYSPAPE